MKDYWIFVIPTPWRWLSLATFAVIVAMYARIQWQQRRVRRRIADIAEPLVGICQRSGFPDEAAQIQQQIDQLRRSPLCRLRRKAA